MEKRLHRSRRFDFRKAACRAENPAGRKEYMRLGPLYLRGNAALTGCNATFREAAQLTQKRIELTEDDSLFWLKVSVGDN